MFYVIVEFKNRQNTISRRDHSDHLTTGSDIFDVLYFYHLNIIVICILYTWMVAKCFACLLIINILSIYAKHDDA